MAADLADGHPARIHRDDLGVEIWEPAKLLMVHGQFIISRKVGGNDRLTDVKQRMRPRHLPVNHSKSSTARFSRPTDC